MEPHLDGVAVLMNFFTSLIALSVGVERITEVFKSFASAAFPALAAKGAGESGEVGPGWRPFWIQLLAMAVGGALAYSLGPQSFLSSLAGAGPQRVAGAVLIGALASGGSAMWNHALDIMRAVKAAREGVVAAQPAPAAARVPAPALR